LQKIYLDYNASTPIALEVAEAMRPFLSDYYGNPSSSHWAGVPAKEAYEDARSQVAKLLDCKPNEIVFTSGGSEANNYAIKGVYYALRGKSNHIITSQIEHPAVSKPCEFLRKQGAAVSYIGVDSNGRVSPEEIERLITDGTILISIMHANNETGVIQPINEISKIAKKYNILFHTDAAQSVGKINTKVTDLGVDLLSIAGHKLYAPKGIGALYVKQGTPLEPLIHGAGHESGRRAGTENIILAVGLGKACEQALETVSSSKIKELRDYFWSKLKQHFHNNVVLNGHPEERLPNTLNVSFPGRVGQDILSRIPELAASTGSACHAGSVELSPVLKAMKVDEHVGMGAIRFSLGKYTTKDELDQVFNQLADVLKD
jgi:cysteine desulfurase